MGAGTDKYITGRVQKFNQKYEMLRRARWDPAMSHLRGKLFGQVIPPKDKDGYTLKDVAFCDAAWFLELRYGHGIETHGRDLLEWDREPIGISRLPSGLKLTISNPREITRNVKKVARFFGASLAGICELDQRWVYSHCYNSISGRVEEFEIPEECKYAIVMAVEMDYQGILTSPTKVAHGAVGLGYSKMAFIAALTAQFIRGLGYRAIPCGNDTALSIPIAIDAGLGELGRNGLLITREFGPRIRLCKVFTDMPLTPDTPAEFGVTEYCNKCRKCARFCPVGAISWGERNDQPLTMSNNGGALKWFVNVERCLEFWIKNNAACSNCVRVCAFNKPVGLLHESVRQLVKYTPWLNSLLIKLDDFAGYGKQVKARDFWASIDC